LPALTFAVVCSLVLSCAGRRDSVKDGTQNARSTAQHNGDSAREKQNLLKNSDQHRDNNGSKNTHSIIIPLVEPKKTQPRKAYIEPTVRVQILGDASSITLTSDSDMHLSFGMNTATVDSDSPIEFTPRSARISVRSYAVGIATFDASEYDKALELAETWKQKNYTVRLIKAGGPLVQADGTIADTTVYWVALGMFRDKLDAERFKDKLFSWGISCWVIDESLISPRGNIEFLIGDGRRRAYANSRVTLESAAPIKIFDVPFGHGFWDSGHRETRSYSSPVEIIVDKKGKLAAINELKLEDYVKGIVPVEIRLNAPEEALKAQAVSARTESLAKLDIQHIFDPYDFCASQHCQEFGGLTRRTVRTDRAVDATRGQVLMHDGSLVDAVYSANCGGHTEHNEHVWTSRPDETLRGVSDLYSNPESFDSPIPASQLDRWLKHIPSAYCSDPRAGARDKFRWRVTYAAHTLNEIVNKHRRVGTIRDIKVLARGVSGRAKTITIVGSQDILAVNKELSIRRILGGLKSSMFVVDISRDGSGNPVSFVFYGGGWGHGVGMCQAGAEGMALQGFTYEQILKHYFSETEIKKLYD
jgi:SpoIID/LytB domain protein